MIPKGQRRYFIIGSLGAFLLCLSLCTLVRSCELRAMGHAAAFATLKADIEEYWNARKR